MLLLLLPSGPLEWRLLLAAVLVALLGLAVELRWRESTSCWFLPLLLALVLSSGAMLWAHSLKGSPGLRGRRLIGAEELVTLPVGITWAAVTVRLLPLLLVLLLSLLLVLLLVVALVTAIATVRERFPLGVPAESCWDLEEGRLGFCWANCFEAERLLLLPVGAAARGATV